uniref:Uncharacterized protein n=1 Tax=Aegilops tauschii subsp. strangulata TaxID=200361 RepID=A0A453LKZ6_AEGTS
MGGDEQIGQGNILVCKGAIYSVSRTAYCSVLVYPSAMQSLRDGTCRRAMLVFAKVLAKIALL